MLCKQRCRLNCCGGMQGAVSGIQMRLCVPGAAPLYRGPMRGGCGGAVPAPRRGAPDCRPRIGSILGIAGSHEPAFPAQFISQPFWSPPCSPPQPIPAALPARAAPGDGSRARISALRDAAPPLFFCWDHHLKTSFLLLRPLLFFPF